MEARRRGELPPWTGPKLPRAHHNTREGEREAFLRRPLVPACVVPPFEPDPAVEERQRFMRRDYVLEGLNKGYPLLENVHDRRIFKTSSPLENFLHIAWKHITIKEWLEETKPRYLNRIQQQPHLKIQRRRLARSQLIQRWPERRTSRVNSSFQHLDQTLSDLDRENL